MNVPPLVFITLEERKYMKRSACNPKSVSSTSPSTFLVVKGSFKILIMTFYPLARLRLQSNSNPNPASTFQGKKASKSTAESDRIWRNAQAKKRKSTQTLIFSFKIHFVEAFYIRLQSCSLVNFLFSFFWYLCM